MDNNQKTNFFSMLALGAELGFLIVIPLVLFLLVGLFLDKKLGTLPLFLIVSLILGFAATIFNVRHMILPFLEKKVGKKN